MSIKMLANTFDSNGRKLLRDAVYDDVSKEDEKILIDRGKAVETDEAPAGDETPPVTDEAGADNETQDGEETAETDNETPPAE